MKPIRLETVVNIATLIACVSVSAAAVHYMRAPARGTAAVAPAQPRVEPGDRLALPSGTLGEPVLAIYLSPACHFCTESMPFYRRLAQREEIRSGAVQFVVASLQPKGEVRAYLSSHGISAKVFANATALGIRTRATPTLVLVNRNGVVRSVWTGLLATAEERDVEAVIADLSKTHQ